MKQQHKPQQKSDSLWSPQSACAYHDARMVGDITRGPCVCARMGFFVFVFRVSMTGDAFTGDVGSSFAGIEEAKTQEEEEEGSCTHAST